MSAGTYQDFFKAVGWLESGDNYSFVSAPGYLGYYQFAEETLQAAGFYEGDSTPARDFSGAWTPLAASFGVTDKASFLAHPAAQDAAATAWFQKVYADLGSLDLVKYEGQTLNGFTLTPSALLAGSHLVGVWALKDYLASGGDTVPQDGGGETVLDYMGRLTGYGTPFAFDHSAPAAIAGGSGPDDLHGWAGGDTLSGGGGADTLFGDAGDDSLSGGAGGDVIRGGDGADTVLGGEGADQLNGNRGNDVVDGGTGGADTLMGGQNDDHVTAHAGDVSLNGNLGADTVTGGSGQDTVHGGQGNDLLDGGAGADQIYGDLGDDTVSGGTGADVFHIGVGGGHDRVLDFNLAEGDRVQVDGGAPYSLAQVGADTVVTLDSGEQLTLAGVQKAALPEGWIV